MPTEASILDAAIAATENEIFGEAFGKEENRLDDTGDRSLEQMGTGLEGQHEPEEEGDESETGEVAETEGSEAEVQQETAKGKGEEPDPKGKQAVEETPVGRVPAGRLREQTEKARQAESERDALKAQLESEKAASQKRLDELNAKFDGVIAALKQQQPVQPKPEQKPDTPPDLFEDPKAFAEYLQKGPQEAIQTIERRLEEMRVNNSMELAHARHGDMFAAAYKAFVEAGQRGDADTIALGQRILKSPNPGESLVQWHKRNEVLRQVGDDPAKYRESVAEETRKQLAADPEFRKQILAELRADAEIGENGKPRTITRMPRSLNGTAGSNIGAPDDRTALDGSESAIFASVFSPQT